METLVLNKKRQLNEGLVRKICFLSLFILVFQGCRQSYNPPSIKNNSRILVVNGFLDNSPDSTFISLTYSRNLIDTVPGDPESGASVVVEGEDYSSFQLKELRAGVYADILFLHPGGKYRLKINIRDGREYVSDYVPFEQTPPIDSVNWKEDSTGVSIFVNTHDPENNTHFYRWEYAETWQYHTYLNSNFDLVNGVVTRRDDNNQIYNCWRTLPSTDILIASTSRLKEDIIYRTPIQYVPKTTEKIFINYSILVKQYALTADGFDYWQNLKKNTEQMGSLFDPQPSQFGGNIHCTSTPGDPVIGFISASSVQQKRIFINGNDLLTYNYSPYFIPCMDLNDISTGISPTDSAKIYEYLVMPRHLFTFLYSDGVYHLAQNFCADCREHGGSNIKPTFWP